MKLIRDELIKLLKTSSENDAPLDYLSSFQLKHPSDEKNGDYYTNVAMQAYQTLPGNIPGTRLHSLAVKGGRNAFEFAQNLVAKLKTLKTLQDVVEDIKVAGPGFINFYLKKEFFLAEMEQASEGGYGHNDSLKGQKTYVEFTDPNPFKEFHIGHLMSNTIGESLARILEANGATVKRANYQGDVGLHVAKSIWGWQKMMERDGKKLPDFEGDSLKVRVEYLGAAYAYGATMYEEDETVKSEIQALNKEIYDGLAQSFGSLPKGVMEMYQTGRAWSLEYFETIYQRLGTKFDEYFFESEAGPVGLKVVEEGLEKGVLTKGEGGAVVFKGEEHGLHTRVFRNQLGLPTYEAKDLGLAKTKWERWQYDRSYIITANEIDEYFKVLLKTLSLLYPDLAKRTTHLSHGMMKLTSGKMSSRTGKVITGEGLLNELKDEVLKKMGEREIENKEKVADLVAVAALKYTVLKQAIGGDITYEPEKITNLEGDTGPYLQYTYARAVSVLKKARQGKAETELDDQELSELELKLLKWIYRFEEVVEEAGRKYTPHMVSAYVYELAQRFNAFYNQEQIVGNEFRVKLTQSVSQTLKSGLNLLGINAPEVM